MQHLQHFMLAHIVQAPVQKYLAADFKTIIKRSLKKTT
jgi:hypothetical protein